MSENRLTTAASAYLRSAAHQPIHWYPWSEEAFEAARAADRPVLLDIGAVWCHWCHVMDGESYEDPELARYLNQHFVCIKVDRDERPDVDARYQRAVQALTSQGGWPLTAFLTPAGEVFYGGTYFPPDGKLGRPGFRTVLGAVLDAYRERRDQVVAQAQAIRRLVDAQLDESGAGELSAAILERAVRQMTGLFDRRNGGFGSQPKFPHPAAMIFLLHRWWDHPSDEVRAIMSRTLQGMGRGGVYDQICGGFHRYSVDAEWIVPHFEKMSYDNSELLKAYVTYAMVMSQPQNGTGQDAETQPGATHSAAASSVLSRDLSSPFFHRSVAEGIVRWVRDVLADPKGGYGASQDADVGLDDDGDYYTWTRDEAAAVLTGREMEVAAAYYDIGTAGEMHHNPAKNVLYIATDLRSLALMRGEREEEVEALLRSAEEKLRAARSQRQAPFVDRTRYTNWNAMMASALLQAGVMLDDDWARAHALRTLRRIRQESAEPDAVAHSPGGAIGLLEDQVHAAAAGLDAYEATGESDWLEWAEAIMERVWRDYLDVERGGLFDRARDSAGEGLLPAPMKPLQDTPTPSPNGVAGMTLVRLHELTQKDSWGARADDLITAFARGASEIGLYGATYLLAVDWLLNPVTHLVIVGEPNDATAAAMHQLALRAPIPRRMVQRLTPDMKDQRRLPAALAAMLGTGAGATAYLCTGNSCQPPARTLDQWRTALEALWQPTASA